MKYFMIYIFGVPSLKIAHKFWVEISRYNVNFTTLDEQSYIYGEATDATIDVIVKKAMSLGFPVQVERG